MLESIVLIQIDPPKRSPLDLSVDEEGKLLGVQGFGKPFNESSPVLKPEPVKMGIPGFKLALQQIQPMSTAIRMHKILGDRQNLSLFAIIIAYSDYFVKAFPEKMNTIQQRPVGPYNRSNWEWTTAPRLCSG